jgi:hypothetical protein
VLTAASSGISVTLVNYFTIVPGVAYKLIKLGQSVTTRMRLSRLLTSYIFQLYKWDKPCAMDFQIRKQRKIKPVILALQY